MATKKKHIHGKNLNMFNTRLSFSQLPPVYITYTIPKHYYKKAFIFSFVLKSNFAWVFNVEIYVAHWLAGCAEKYTV